MTLTNATAVMTTKTRTQAPSSRRSPSRPTLLGLGDDLLGGLHEVDADLAHPLVVHGARLRLERRNLGGREHDDLHAVLLELVVRRRRALEPLAGGGLLPRRHLDRRLAADLAVGGRGAVPPNLQYPSYN